MQSGEATASADTLTDGAAAFMGTTESSSYIRKIFQRVFETISTPPKQTRSNFNKTEHRSDSEDDRHLLRDAMIIEYLQPGAYQEHHVLKFKYSVRHVQRMAGELPAGLEDTEHKRTLFRAVSDKLHIPYHGAFTRAELREALFSVRSSMQMKVSEACDRFGVGRTAMHKHLKKIASDHGMTDDALRACLESIEFRDKGAPRLFTTDEIALLLTTSAAAKRLGQGQNQKQIMSDARRILKTQADQTEDPQHAERLRNAKCGTRWFYNQKKRAQQEGLVDLTQRAAKTQKMSQKRAALTQSWLTAAMFSRIASMYQEHHEKGILKTKEPHPSQIYNGDEIGFDPTGKWSRVLSFRWDKTSYTVGSGEKAPFWVSVFFWSRADGLLNIPPCIIHQGQSGRLDKINLMCGTEFNSEGKNNFVPQGFCMYQSPSGYNDREGFQAIARHFVDHCGPVRPLYIFVDGHDSHWDPAALKFFRDNLIFPFFLRSGNSEQDQPNDNGPNAHLKALYEQAYMEFFAFVSGVSRAVVMTPPVFNLIFCATWELFISTSAQIVQKAFLVTGLYPLDPKAADEKPGASTMGAMFSGEVSIDAVQNPDSEGGLEVANDVQQEAILITSTNTNVSKGAIIRKVVLDYVLKPRAKDSAVVHKELMALKQAKKVSVSTKRPTSNPSTLTGCYVTDALIAEVEQAEANKKLNEEDATRRKEEGERKRVERRAKAKAAWDEMVALCATTSAAEVAQKAKVDQLKLCVAFHGLKLPGKGNKGDLVPMVAKLLEDRPPPPADEADLTEESE